MHYMYVWGLTFEGTSKLMIEEVLLLSILINKSESRNKFRYFAGIIELLNQNAN